MCPFLGSPPETAKSWGEEAVPSRWCGAATPLSSSFLAGPVCSPPEISAEKSASRLRGPLPSWLGASEAPGTVLLLE